VAEVIDIYITTMNKSPIKEILREYISGIKRFESLMKDKYNLNQNPWEVLRVFDRIGTIGDYSYHYLVGAADLIVTELYMIMT